MPDSRRWSPEGSSRRKKDSKRPIYDEPPRMRSSAESLSSSSSSSSSSYIDISRRFPNRSGLRAFFTTPSERRRLRKRRSSRLLKLNNSSSSSVNSDLAYGTGFIKRPKSRGVRSRQGKEIDRERHRDFNREREPTSHPREKERSLVSRATTDAEILAVGAGLAKLARDQNKQDLKGLRNGQRSEIFAVKQSSSSYDNQASRGLGSSKVPHRTGIVDDDGWESASDAESESSVDSKLAFGGESQGGWFGWGGAQHKPQSRKSSIVDPRLFGPANSLNGIITEPVGFGDVSWSSNSDFGQRSSVPTGPVESNASGSQSSLQRVYPIPTSDPSRFEAARSSVISGAEPYISSRPAPIPLQQPQPIAPVSQSVYEPTYSTRGEPSILPNSSTPSGRSKSLAEAALMGVAGAAVGAVIASDRKDDRKDKRRDDRDIRDDDRTSKRRETERKEERDDRRRDRRDSPDRDDRKQRRREKDRQRDSVDDQRRDKKREKHREDDQDDGRDERREKRREERRNERSDDRYESRRTKSETSISTTSVDPFQYQVEDDAFSTPIAATPVTHSRVASVPTVVTVEREPAFARKRSSSIKDQSVTSNSNPRRDDSVWDEKEQRYRTRESRDKSLHNAESIYQETEHSTAPIEIAAIGAAVAAVNAEDYRESRSDRRRDERRGERRDFDGYNSSSRKKDSSRGSERERERKPDRDPIQEEADRAYREIVMARKIASQVIRSRTPSPDRSVVDKYDDSQGTEIIRIVTPPGMEDHKKEGPYDAPNADFKLDLVMEDPRELHSFNIPPISLGSNRGIPFLKRDPDASEPRPHLNLVRPTPTPSPMPEKQAARAESSKPSKPKDQGTSTSSDAVIDNKGNVVPSPTSSVSKGVTWGENETKHYEVESPQEHRDEFVSSPEIQAREKSVQEPIEKAAEKPVEKPKSSSGSKRGGWGAIAAGIIGVGAAAGNSSETSKTSKTTNTKENESSRSEKRQDASFEYRGVAVEPESAPIRKDTRSPPSTGPKPSAIQNSRVPGAFDDDLDFTATVAAGLQDTGFDPNIVINDPTFRRRDSPPGSNQPGVYRAPFAETVSDLGSMPGISSELQRDFQGSVPGEAFDSVKDSHGGSPDHDNFSIKLSKKEQKKREKAARRQSGDDVFPLDQGTTSKGIVDEPDPVFEAKLSKKEQKKRDKAAQKQGLQNEDVTPTLEPSVAEEIVEEPESYFETPKKSKSKKSKRSSTFDDFTEDTSRDDRKVSVPVDAFDDLRNGEDEWDEPKKSKKKSKRDSERFDSPSRSTTSEIAPDLERSSSKKSKDKSRRKSEQYDLEADPTEVSLPPSTPSETSRDGELDETRKSRKASKRDSAERDDSRSVVSADASRYIDDDNRKSKKKSRSSTKYDFDDTRSVASAPAGDEFEDSKKSKKKDKRNSGSFFGLFGSKSESGARDESPKGSKDDFEEARKKSKKSKRNSVPDGLGLYGDIGSQSISDLAGASSNGNGHRNGAHIYDDERNEGPGSDNEKKSSRSPEESPSSKKESFLAKAGTLGAGVGLAGAAVAIATQHRQQSKADKADGSQLPKQAPTANADGSSPQHHEIFDPEITQRQFRPSIDPQYGDLLPLPPSDPASPNVEPIEDLPGLPDSRPDTPEAERLTRDKSLSSIRKPLQDAPVKSPSQSAVPLKFVMGNRSTPSSPGLVRSSPMQSPATPRDDSLGFPRLRPRPTSWDSTKEYKPLYLVESNRHGSSAQQHEAEQNLPSLPPSQSTSRTSSQIDFSDVDAPEQHPLDKLDTAETPLVIDTDFKTPGSPDDLLDSQQSTPKADVKVFDIGDSPISLNAAEPSSLPVLPLSRSLDNEPESLIQSQNIDGIGAQVLTGAGLVSSIGYFASSPSYRATKDAWLDELPSHSPIQRQPSPVDPVTKDRSSYLLQSSPLSRKFEDSDPTDDPLDSPATHRASTYSDSEGVHRIHEREGNDIFGQFTQSGSNPAIVSEPPLGKVDKPPSVLEASLSSTEVVDEKEIGLEQSSSSAFSAIDNTFQSVEEEDFAKSKRDRKKNKKKGKGLSRTSTMDEMSLPTAAQENSSVESTSRDKEIPEGSSSKRSKKDRQSKELSRSSTVEDLSVPDSFEQMAQPSSGPEEIKSIEDNIGPKSRKDKKKGKKNATFALSQDPQAETIPEVPSESQAPLMGEAAADSASASDLWNIETKRSKKGKKKGMPGVAAEEAIEMNISGEGSDVAAKSYIPTDSPLASVVAEENMSAPRDYSQDVSDEKSGFLPDEGSDVAAKNYIPTDSSLTSVVAEENMSALQDYSQDLPDEKFGFLPDKIASTDEDSMVLPEQPAPTQEALREHLEENRPVEVPGSAPNQRNKEEAEISVHGIRTENPSTLEHDDARTLLTAEPPVLTEVKKGKKKKKGKSGLSWEPQEEEPDIMQQPSSQKPDEVEVPTSKKNKKKSKQPQSSASEVLAAEGLAAEGIAESSESSKQLGFSSCEADVIPDETLPESLSVLSQRDAKSPTGDLEAVLPTTVVPVATSSSDNVEIRTVLEENREPIESKDITSPSLENNSRIPPLLADSTEESSKVPREAFSEEAPSIDSRLVAQDLSTPKVTPVGGPGAWPVTPITPWATASEVLPGPPSLGYFPSAASLHSPKSHQDPDTSAARGYFPSATALLPVAGATAVGIIGLDRGIDDLEPEISHVESQAPPATPDGLKSGYEHEQLSLARQLQEEFGSGSKKSKKKKNKRQSLPSTPDSEIPRSRGVENLSQMQPRARSLSIGPSAIGEKLDDGQISAQRKNVYSEDQLELASQLKAEFELGNKKGKKDKKKRPGLASRSSTHDAAISEQPFEELPPTDSQTISYSDDANPIVDSPKGDGFTAGYQEDQLSLARQLQAEFGSKKSKKEKKRRNVSQTRMEDPEIPDDSFGDIPQPVVSELSRTSEGDTFSVVDPHENDLMRDGLASGYGEDQLELARQLKAEFGSNTKKSKKDKKRKSLSREVSDQLLDTPQTTEDSPEHSNLSREAEINDLAAVTSELPLPVPEDGFETKKRKSKGGKKGQKRESLFLDNDNNDVSSMSTEKGKDELVDAEQATVDLILPTPHDELTPSASKLEEDRSQDNLLAVKDENPIGAEVEALPNSPEFDAASKTISDEKYDAPENKTPVSRKNSKKGKKKGQRNNSEGGSLDVPDTDTGYEPIVIEEESTDIGPNLGGVEDTLPSERPDNFAYPTKKSKKDKKKQKNPIELSIVEPTPDEQTGGKDVVRTDATSSPSNATTAPLPPALSDQDPEFELISKGSKKTKKKRQSVLASASDYPDTGESTTAQSYPGEQQNEIPDNERQVIEPSPDQPPSVYDPVSSIAEGATDANFGGFTLTSKKSKKDKKGRKGASIAGSEERSGLATPTDPMLGPEDPMENVRTPMDTDEQTVPDSVPQPSLPENSNLVETTVDESIENPDDEWGSFKVKKPKKDKKKRKSGLSTPAEPVIAAPVSTKSPDRIFETDEPHNSILQPINKDQDLLDSQASSASKDTEVAPEPLEFVTKASKKDKKKRKSGLSTPLEEILPVEQPNYSPDHEALLECPPSKEEVSEFPTTRDIPVEPVAESETEPIISRNETSFEPELVAASPALEKAQSLEDPVPETVLPSDLEAPDENRINLGENALLDSPERKLSKKDKRKRKTADTTSNNKAMSAETPLTSWADQVEEAEIERKLPVIEDIAKNESLAHIPSSIEADHVDDFVRPVKKGKKSKKGNTGSVTSSSKEEPLSSIIGDDTPKTEDRKNFMGPVLAVTGALVGTALIAGASNASKTADEPPPDPPTRKLSKKEKRKKSIDRRSNQQDDPFDDPVLWEGEESKAFEEPMGVDDGNGSDGFWTTQDNHDERIEIPDILEQPRSTDETPIVTDEQPVHEVFISDTPVRQDPEHYIETGKLDVAESLHSSDPQKTDTPDENNRNVPNAIEQGNNLPDEFIVPSSKKAKKKSKQTRLSAWDSPHDNPKEVEPSTTAHQSLLEAPRNIVEESVRDEGTYSGEVQTSSQETSQSTSEPLNRSSYNDEDTSFQDNLAYEDNQINHLSTKTYSHPGSSSLPVVREESPGPVDLEPPAAPFSHTRAADDANRDSAFVAESPIPRQRSPVDHEYVRDSGVHLRDFSPAPVSATDDAIARMSWPTVDEETETVDLERSQRLKKETSPGHDGKAFSEVPILHGEQVKAKSRTKEIESERAEGYDTAHSKSRPAPKTQRDQLDAHRDEVSGRRGLHESHHESENTSRHPDNKASDFHSDLRQKPTEYGSQKAKDIGSVRQRVERIESPDIIRSQRPKEAKYGSLNSSETPRAEKSSKSTMVAGAATALAGASMGFGAARQSSREQRPGSVGSNRSTSNINRLRTPDPKHRPESVGSNRSSGTPPLRRSDRKSGDLRSLSQHSRPDLAKEAELAAITTASNNASVVNANPTANEGRIRAKDMADVYDGFGEGRMGSPRSPTRPHSMRRRQSMQVLDLESRLEQLAAENRMLADAKAQAERTLQSTQESSSTLIERDAEIDSLKRTLDWLQNEVTRLTEVNDGLTSANITLGNQHNDRYGSLESQHAHATRELQELRDSHNNLSAGMEGIVKNEVQSAVQDKDREIAQLRAELDAAKEQIREMQRQILSSKSNDSEFLTVRDEDYFDTACQQLCQHVQQWVLRFSKFSDMRACRLTSEINNDKIIDRLDNAILDGSDVDSYLADRVKRRDVFMSMTMTMVWEFVFTRYLFGMDREQRQKLKSLEKLLSEVGPAAAVHQWRATTLTLLSKREAFVQQREQDTLAVVNAILETLTEILPPPSHLEDQIQEQLVRVMKAAVDLSIEMRTQRAEYMMLPPLQPEYDANGDLASKVSFNAALMNERSGDTVSNEQLEEDSAVVRIVLFPLVVKKGDDSGEGDEEIVVCPAQVLVAKPKKTVRVFSPESMAHQNHSRVSMQSSMPADYGDNSVI